MRKIWSTLPISYKIFLTILLFMLLIQSITMAYLWQFESSVLIDKEKQTLKRELQSERKKLREHLLRLAKETRFLASLEVMDDLIGKDIDKRIEKLIKRRAKDLGEGIIIVAMTNSAFVAASKEEFISKNLQSFHQKLQQEFLYFNAPVFSSFDKSKHLGTIVMLYPLANLAQLHMDNPDKKLWLTAPRPLVNFPQKNVKEHIYMYENMHGILEGWTLHLSFSKEKALMTLKEIQNILITTFLFSLLLLIGVIFILSHKLTKPLHYLSKMVDEIIKTKDYSKQVEVTSQDELGKLSNSFNVLTQNTKNLLGEIGAQNRLHLGQLEALITFFNALIQTQTEEEVIYVAKVHLKRLLGVEAVHFSEYEESKQSLPMMRYDYQKSEEKKVGYLLMQGESPLLHKRDFRDSIAKMIQQQLEHIDLQDATQKALEAKSTFLSVISHDLRTPLGSILNLTQHLMLRECMQEEELSMLGGIETSSEHLLAMINNILQLAKLESNSIMIDKKEIDLSQLLEEIFDIVSPLIAIKGLNLQKQFFLKKAHCVSDENILKQIIINLLSNAIKFTKKGEIVVQFYQEKEQFVCIVKDSGIGIDSAKQKKLFQPFYQASQDAKEMQDSSGLGLALSQKMAYLINGEIEIESAGIGKGTSAILRFKSF